MESPDLVTVFWSDYEDHVAGLCSDLHQDRREADVILLSRDGARIAAHSFFLLRSSPVLAALLLPSEFQPVLHLTGISGDNLHSLLQFLYLGHVYISPANVDELHSLARDLEITPLENVLTSLRRQAQDENKIEKVDYNDGDSLEDYDILEIDPKVQSIVLIDYDELYSDFLHQNLPTKLELPAVSEIPLEENVQLNHKEDESKESKDEETQEKGVIRVEDKSYINDNDEDCLVDEKIFESDTDLTLENQTSDQDEREVTSGDDYEEDDYEDYEEQEIFDFKDKSHREKSPVKPKPVKTRGNFILPKLASSQCPECGETFKNKRRVRRHYVRKHVGRRFQCQYCDKNYLESVHLRRHIRVEHDRIRVNCDQCESEFTEQKSLKKHIRTVHENFIIKCEYCDYVTSSSSNLKNHRESVHEGVRYPCEKCDKKFSNKSYLHKHNRAVHDKVRFACTLCDKTYTHRNSLALHVQAHHDKVKYSCNICNMELNSRRNQLHHYRRKHSGNDNVWDVKNYKL